MPIAQTKAVKDDDGVVIPLPDEVAFADGTDLLITRSGDVVTIRVAPDASGKPPSKSSSAQNRLRVLGASLVSLCLGFWRGKKDSNTKGAKGSQRTPRDQ
jgi:hypothetical protein